MARETLEALLRREGYTMLFAASGAEVLANMGELAPDLILLDVMMPGMNGFEVCQRLKQSAEYRHIPIVLVTALDSKSDLVKGLDSGADEFIAKPFNSPELKARIRSMLRIKKQYDELQYTLQTRDMLSSMIVHDMRNPLAAVMLYIQLLKRRGNFQPEQERYLDMIFNEAHHVSSFLEDMLLLNKLDRGSVPLAKSQIDLSRIATEVRQKVAGMVSNRKVQLEVADPPPSPPDLEVDMVLFLRAVENMVAHAVKSTPAHSTVQVSFLTQFNASAESDPPRLRIAVCNGGTHLPTEDLVRIFDKFAVLALKDQGKSHVGLGLAYCRMVVEAHGGRVAAANLEPQGLMFTIDLP
jgi:two-component system sensor histidine kinase/response regulator